MQKTLREPPGLYGAPLKWWRSVVEEYRFDGAGEIELLAQAGRTLMIISQCEAGIAEQGLLIPGQNAPVVNPLIRELRQQRLAFAQLLKVLHIATSSMAKE